MSVSVPTTSAPFIIRPDDKIRKGTSIYHGHIVTDRELINYMGVDTYCRLHRRNPELYNPYTICVDVSTQPNNVELVLMGYDGLRVKTELIAYIVTGQTSQISNELILPTERRPRYLDVNHDRWATLIWIFILLIMVGVLAFVLVMLGAINLMGPPEPVYCTNTWLTG